MTDSSILFGSVLPDGINAVARGGIAASQRKLPAAVRQVHRGLLREFLSAGRAPSAARLRSLALAGGLDPEQVIDELAGADLVHLDPAGEDVLIAYPGWPPRSSEACWPRTPRPLAPRPFPYDLAWRTGGAEDCRCGERARRLQQHGSEAA